MSPRYTHELAFKIGSACQAEDVSKDDVLAFLRTFNMSTKGAERFIIHQIAPMLQRLEIATGEFPRELKLFDDFIGQELMRLSDVLDLGLVIRERDYFAPRAGGWAAS